MARGPEPKAPRPAWSKALLARRVHLDLLQSDVSERTEDEISQGTVSDLERGKTELVNMTAPRLSALAAALEWSIEEMEAATGLRLKALTAAHDLGKASRAFQSPMPHPHEADSVRIPELGEYEYVQPRIIAHAGPGDSLETLPRGPTRLVHKRVFKTRYAEPLLVTGDSMARPDGSGIHDGDLMMLDPHDLDLRDGEVYLMRVPGNGFYLKRAKLVMGTWWLYSDNPAYPPYKEEEAQIIGCAYLHVPQPRKP